jgi:formylglycine-generating enzyme required for sulfatase activity
MGSNLVITGNVTGRMVVGAMLRAQAATVGNLVQKQVAGVGVLSQHLDSAGMKETWQQSAGLSPEIVIARASVNSGWLKSAGELIEKTSNPQIRAGLLGQIITPHLRMLASLFGDEIEKSDQKPQMVEVGKISHLLESQLPEIQLEMRSVPAGKFPMGSSKNANEKFTDGVQHQVELSEFLIGKYEVTVAQYQKYLELTGANQPKYWDDPKFGIANPNHPVVGVSWHDSVAFAQWLGMRLPTEAEGEFAARAWGEPDKNGVYQCREYPWGDDLDLNKVTFNTDGTRPVNAHSVGASYFGVMDLAGNVWEWRNNWYDGEGYDPANLKNPQGSSQGTYRVLRGGSWCDTYPVFLRSACRCDTLPEYRYYGVGFRLAEDKK